MSDDQKIAFGESEGAGCVDEEGNRDVGTNNWKVEEEDNDHGVQ